ncbi:MAG TPA: hypothetical protein ENK83_04890 [Aliiroseovarius sp.]|nr:hypothetical protein [Aliiroseovarius sp.]
MEAAPRGRASGPNPINPDRITARERRAELCGLLALGIVRLHEREASKPSENIGESSLHFLADLSVHATPTRKEDA